LLGLPQRQAADVLGISESMLCKRYKECTKRKWPYRYLGKLEKKIAVKEELLKKNGSLSTADRNMLDSLLKEKEQCLTPVSIRVTDPDGGSEKKQIKTQPNTEESVGNFNEEEFDPADILMALSSTR
jgi:hypothetical protein